jgi:hypothetical protein
MSDLHAHGEHTHAREDGADGSWLNLHCDAQSTPSGLRRIEPISLTGLDIDTPESGEPICEHVDPSTLFVDPAYQRDIGDRGMRQIRRIVEAWDWNRFKPPICAYADHEGQTVLKVLDGQHTAIAAASHPGIHLIPCMIVDAAETSSQAAAFVGQNTDRLGVTPLQLHKAAVTAQDDDALTVKQVCDRAGVSILQYSVKSFEVGQTVAIGALKKLVVDRGAMKSRIILEVLVKGGMAPVLAPQVKAVEALICEPEYKDEVKLEDLYQVVHQSAWKADNSEAKMFAATHSVPFWRALAVIWFQKAKKRRKPTGRAAA